MTDRAVTQTPGPDAAPLDLEAGFDAAAPRYDLLVALNPGYHRHLRAAARDLVGGLGAVPRLLDLGCGSGASTAALVAATDETGAAEAPRDDARAGRRIVGVDASGGMLARARRKRWPAGVGFVHATAQELDALPAVRDLGPADGVFAAYLLRNVPEPERDDVVAAIARSLRPGGRFVTQEYSISGRRARAVWTAVCRLVVVPLSVLVRGNPDLYRYLWRSVLDFDSTDVLADRLRRAGFVDVRVATVGGWQRGILHTVSGTVSGTMP